MSYTAKEWVTGDDINISDLNNMEGGIDAAANPFIVTLTPTALDYSGTMDKTCGELTDAYNAGKRIVAVVEGLYSQLEMSYAIIGRNDNNSIVFLLTADLGSGTMLIEIKTTMTNRADNDYSTAIFPLTPMT